MTDSNSDVLTILADAGLSADALEQADKLLHTDIVDDDPPWFVRLLQGGGAWLTTLLFLLFLGFSGIFSGDYAPIITGLVMLVTSLFFSRQTSDSQTPFVSQLLLAGFLTGFTLLALGLFKLTENISMTAVALALPALCFLLFSPSFLQRFFSTQLALGCLLLLMSEYELLMVGQCLLIIGMAGTITAMWLNESRLVVHPFYGLWRSLKYSLAIGLLLVSATFGYHTHLDLFYNQSQPATDRSWFLATSLGLGIILLLLARQVLIRLKLGELRWQGLIGVVIACLVLPFYRAPEILAALLVLLLGIERGNRILVPLALVSLSVFLIRYYYLLEISLLQKSLWLMAGGGLLLVTGTMIWRMQRKDSHV